MNNLIGSFTIIETINTLKAIFEKHKEERVCVIGTICVGIEGDWNNYKAKDDKVFYYVTITE